MQEASAPAETPAAAYTYTRYVRHGEVAEFERKGWARSDALAGTHHGFHAVLMIWRGAGEPK